MLTISQNLKENILIGQGLADIRQRETPLMCVMQIRYHFLHSRFIRNTFLRFATALASICNICKTDLLGS